MIMDRRTRQNTTKDSEDMNNTINQLDLTDIYRTLHPTIAEYILPKCTWKILQDRSHAGPQSKPQ